jgi:hypothetical protein
MPRFRRGKGQKYSLIYARARLCVCVCVCVCVCRICIYRCDCWKKFCPFEFSDIPDAAVSVIMVWNGRPSNRGSISGKSTGLVIFWMAARNSFPGDKTPVAYRYSFQHTFTLYAIEKRCLYLVGIVPSNFPGKSVDLSNDIPYIIEITFKKIWQQTPQLDRASLLSRSHDHTQTHKQSVGFLWTIDQPVADTSTREHTTLTRERHHCPWRD